MTTGQHSTLILLCILLNAWSVDATLSKQGITMRGTKTHRKIQMDDDDDEDDERDYSGDRDDEEEEEDEDKNEDTEEDDETDNDAKAGLGPKPVPMAFSQFTKKAVPAAAAPAAPPQQLQPLAPAAAPAAPPAPAMAPLKIVTPACASVNDAAKKKVCLAENALAKNQAKQKQLTAELARLSDETKSEEEIDASAKRVANETDSKALGSTLASMWKEMRMFDLPFYAQHVEEEIHLLKRDEATLKKKLEEAKKDAKLDKKGQKNKEKDDKKGDKQNNEHMDQLKAPVADAQKNPAKAANSANFWAMNAKQKEEFFVGSLIYVLGSLLFAFIYYKLSKHSKSQKFFLPEARPEMSRHANQRDFSFGLFECFATPYLCILGCCCPSMTWSNTLDRQGLWTFFKAFLVILLLVVLNSYTYGLSTVGIVILGVYYRQKLRKINQIESGSGRTVAYDILAWTFCTTCAVIQEAREDAVGAIPASSDFANDAP